MPADFLESGIMRRVWIGRFWEQCVSFIVVVFDDDVVDLFAPSMVGWVAENQIIVFEI